MSTCTMKSQIFVYLLQPMEYYLPSCLILQGENHYFVLDCCYCTAICLNTSCNVSTCGFLKSWSVEFKSNGLNFSSFDSEKLSANEIEQSTGKRLTLLRCCFISSFLSVIKILFLSSLIHNLTVMFFKGSAKKGVRYFLFQR